MTIDLAKENESRRLYDAEKWKRGTIASELGVHPDVVDRVLDAGAGPPLLVAPRPRLIDPYVDFIGETLAAHPRLRATRLFDMIRMRGFEGGIAIVRRHVAEVRPVPRGEVYLRTERLIGEQAQVDWAHVGKLSVPGGERALWVFVMVLAYSRAMWAELVFDLTIESLRRSLVRASNHFGGVTRQWLFDCPKIVVLERHGDAVRFHPGMLEIAGALRVQPRLCRPRRPTDKGGVERAVRYLRDRFFAARTILSLEDGNRQLLEFVRDIASPLPHPRFRDRTVAEVFAEEKERLLSQPGTLPETDLVAAAPVDTRRSSASGPISTRSHGATPGLGTRSRSSRATPRCACSTATSSWHGMPGAGRSINASRTPSIGVSCSTTSAPLARRRCVTGSSPRSPGWARSTPAGSTSAATSGS